MLGQSDPLFLDFESWRYRNQDIEESLLADDRFVCLSCDGSGEVEDDEGDEEECGWCDGSGEASSGDKRSELARLMREIYQTQLERDYRLAVQNLSLAMGV